MPDYTYTLTLLVRDAPGVLVRVAQVFARRGCNINSIHVSPNKDKPWSNMKITVKNVARMDQIIHSLEKLIDVKSVHVHEEGDV